MYSDVFLVLFSVTKLLKLLVENIEVLSSKPSDDGTMLDHELLKN